MHDHNDQLTRAVSRLPREMNPPQDLWNSIESRIAAPQRQQRRTPWLALVASVAAVAVVVGVWTVGSRDGALQPQVAADSADFARSQSQTGLLLASHVDLQYSGALKSLSRAMDRADPADGELGEVELSLRTLQRATEDIRAAIAQDPDAEYLVDLLESTHRQRIELLKDIALAGPQKYETQRI